MPARWLHICLLICFCTVVGMSQDHAEDMVILSPALGLQSPQPIPGNGNHHIKDVLGWASGSDSQAPK